MTNKLYTQLTISPKQNLNTHKEPKIPALKKRRSSTSDKPNDIQLNEGHKKSKVLELCDIYCRNNGSQSIKVDNPVFASENSIDKKSDGKHENTITATNGKSSNQVSY